MLSGGENRYVHQAKKKKRKQQSIVFSTIYCIDWSGKETSRI